MNSWYIILDKTNLEKINKTKCDYWREPNMKKTYWQMKKLHQKV